jgi:hypothetical protein
MTTRPSSGGAIAVAVALCLSMAPVALAQTPAAERPRGAAAVPSNRASPEPPVSLERIRHALERAPEPRLKLPDSPTFSIAVQGRVPRIEDFIDLRDLSRGPVSTASVTHREFLSMVTPSEARPFASSVNGDLLQVLATSFATGLALSSLSQVVDAFKDGRRKRESARAREEVRWVLAELEWRRRQQAGRGVDAPGEAPNAPVKPPEDQPPR